MARVAGVLTVEWVNLFRHNSLKQWEMVEGDQEQEMSLEEWQLPELLDVVVMESEDPITDLDEALDMTGVGGAGVVDTDGIESKIAMPVVPEICK